MKATFLAKEHNHKGKAMTELSRKSLVWDLANIFCQKLDSKYCRLYGHCLHYPLCTWSTKAAIDKTYMNGCGSVPIQLCLQTLGWVWSVGCKLSLFIAAGGEVHGFNRQAILTCEDFPGPGNIHTHL